MKSLGLFAAAAILLGCDKPWDADGEQREADAAARSDFPEYRGHEPCDESVSDCVGWPEINLAEEQRREEMRREAEMITGSNLSGR